MPQLTLDFDGGMTARFKTLKQACAHCVYASRKGLSVVAADLDMSPSELSRRLSVEDGEPDNRPLRVEDLEGIIVSTGDHTPVYYLIEKFLQDSKVKRDQAIAQLAAMAPTFIALAEQAGMGVSLKSGKKA